MSNMYYDYQQILSYNALLNLLIGERGVGKTYGATKFVVDDFKKRGNEFAYIRRYKSELKKSVPNFFSAVNSNNEFPNNHLYSKGNNFYCDDVNFGYAMTLATAQDLKSVNFSKVKTIIFDEFIIEEGQKKYYLKNEVFIFLNLIETISRLRDVRVFMLANSASSTNPYFLYFDLTLPYNNDIKLFKEDIDAKEWVKIYNNYRIKLKLCKNENRIKLIICDAQNNLTDDSIYWNLSDLKERIEKKLKYLAFITANCYINNRKKYFIYNNIKFYKLKNFNYFIDSIETGKIKVRINVDISHSTKYMGKLHDHGATFRIKKELIEEIFERIYIDE